MRRLLYSMLLLTLCSAASRSAEPDGWRPLFNGKNLDGWDTWLTRPHKTIELDLKKNAKGDYVEPLGRNRDPLKVYTVVTADGEPAIRITGQIFGALTTKEEFENYHLRFEVKWGEKKYPPRDKAVRDSGLLYHCTGPHGGGSGGPWMKSFESQIQENDFGDFFSVSGVIVDVEGERKGDKGPITFKKGGKKFTGLTSRIIRNPKSEKPHGQWNVVELYAVGPTSVHVNNGVPNMVLTGLRHKVNGRETPLTKGKIQLQSEGAEVYYRKIEVRKIDKIPEELLK